MHKMVVCVFLVCSLMHYFKNNFCYNDIVFKGIVNIQKRKEVTKRQQRNISIEIDR